VTEEKQEAKARSEETRNTETQKHRNTETREKREERELCRVGTLLSRESVE
jgi:hypothetical protein